MGVLALETGITYGPIRSRRLGWSLGVNLLSTRHKLCSFDCVYCHYGTTEVTTLCPSGRDFPWPDEVVRAVDRALREHRKVDYLTLSGNGEPTLHPAFPSIVQKLRLLLDQVAPDTRLALFSNATTVHRPEIRTALDWFDLPILKLDAGDGITFRRINRPAREVRYKAILEGLREVPNLVLQTVMVDGTVTNARGRAYEQWVDRIGELQPAWVQIYSTDYPVPQNGVERVLPYVLRDIAEDVERRTGVRVQAYWR